MRQSTAGGWRPKAPAGLSYGRGRTKRSDDGRSWLGSTPGGAGITRPDGGSMGAGRRLRDAARSSPSAKLDRPEVGCVRVESEVGARLMVIGKVSGQDAAKVSLAEDQHVIQALAPDRPDEALRERILPGAAGQPDPQQAIGRAQPRPGRHSLVDGELLAQGQVLEGELTMAADEEREEPKQTFSGSCQAIFLGRCRSCCRAIVAKWYCSSYGTRRSHRTKMIFTHFAPNARSAS